MSLTLAFDVYGTLIDPHGIRDELERHVGEEAGRFSRLWREKQLEYSFRRAAMGAYRDFAEVTRDALTHTCTLTDRDLAADVRETLLASYRTLPTFDDATGALRALGERGVARYAFSNGRPADLSGLLRHAALDKHLDGVISVHDVKSFKPDPRVYAHFNALTGSAPGDTWLISSNPFDIIGAAAVGWKSVWVRRAGADAFDPWEFEPDEVVGSLAELDALFHVP